MFSLKMAPRRSVKPVKVINNNNYNNLSLTDVLCPICRCIFIEPVTLPCSHGFCYPCFEGTLANANLTCPLCRVRFGSWHRLAKKEQKIVNAQFWDAIKVSFPIEVKNRLNGIDDQLEEPPQIRITSPGNIRREYELQRKKEEERLAKEKVEALKASEELIKKIRAEEEREEAARQAKLKLDEQVAKQIAKDINCGNQACNSKMTVTLDRKPVEKYMNNKKQCLFLYKIQNKNKVNVICPENQSIIVDNAKINGFLNANSMIVVSDKNDCVNSDLMHFKPIEQLNVPLKKFVSPIKVPARVNKVATVIIRPPNGKTLFAHNTIISAFASFINSNRNQVSIIKSTNARKRKALNQNDESNNEFEITKVSPNMKDCNYNTPRKRPAIHNVRQTDKAISIGSKFSLEQAESSASSSPPFFGFDNRKSTKETNDSNKTKFVDNYNINKKLQEEQDLEYAKQLHDELNKNNRYCTRNSIVQKNLLRKRQITLDHFITSPKSSII